MRAEDHRELQRVGERQCTRCLQSFAAHLTDQDGRRAYGTCADFTTAAGIEPELAPPIQYPDHAAPYLAGKWWTPQGIVDNLD